MEMISIRKLSDTSIYLLSSILVTLFLFYIDEGYYSFQWMTNAGAWIIFVIYVFVFFLTQVGINFLFTRVIPLRIGRALSLFVGIVTGMIFLILIFYQSLGK